MDINRFIPSACHTVLRDEISDEGAAGTVDGEFVFTVLKSTYVLCWGTLS